MPDKQYEMSATIYGNFVTQAKNEKEAEEQLNKNIEMFRELYPQSARHTFRINKIEREELIVPN